MSETSAKNTNPFVVLFGLLVVFSGCSPRNVALRVVADALGSGSSSSFQSDEDVELVLESLPFALKSMESLHEKVPDHKGLCLSLAQGFMLYTYGKLETESEYLKESDYKKFKIFRERIAKLYRRAYNYGFLGLGLVDSDFKKAYKKDNKTALRLIQDKEDVPLLYWTAAALAKWIAFSKNNPSVIIKLPEVKTLMARALALDSTYDNGAIHEFLANYESLAAGDSAKAMIHYQKAVKASGTKKASIFLTYIEAFAIPGADESAFDSYLQRILDFDIEKYPEYRLVNAITRKKAQLLQSQKENYFLGDDDEDDD